MQQRLVPFHQEGDRLRRFRGQLPCEVVVTAVTHPLHGCRLRAYAVRGRGAALKVELPDGMPGLVSVEATDALGAEPAGAGAGLVLDGDGLRRLRAVVVRLRDGMRLVLAGNGPGRDFLPAVLGWRLVPVPGHVTCAGRDRRAGSRAVVAGGVSRRGCRCPACTAGGYLLACQDSG